MLVTVVAVAMTNRSEDVNERIKRRFEGRPDFEGHYFWVCPFDGEDCAKSVEGLYFGFCYYEILGLVCPRFDGKIDVFRCPFSRRLPCNKWVAGFGFGACRDDYYGGELRRCCSRFVDVLVRFRRR